MFVVELPNHNAELDGISRYKLKLVKSNSLSKPEYWLVSNIAELGGDPETKQYAFTKEEIEAYEPAYLAFAKPLEEFTNG